MITRALVRVFVFNSLQHGAKVLSEGFQLGIFQSWVVPGIVGRTASKAISALCPPRSVCKIFLVTMEAIAPANAEPRATSYTCCAENQKNDARDSNIGIYLILEPA